MAGKRALIIIDIINDFDFKHGPELLANTEIITPNIIKMKKYAKKNRIPIIYVNDHYRLWQADLSKIIDHCKNSKSEKIISKLAPNKDDFFLIKPKHSAFHQTALQALLSELRVNQLILTGIAGNICVLFTANDAYMREYNISVPSDCIASNDEQDNNYAIRMMENVLDANTKPSTSYLN